MIVAAMSVLGAGPAVVRTPRRSRMMPLEHLGLRLEDAGVSVTKVRLVEVEVDPHRDFFHVRDHNQGGLCLGRALRVGELARGLREQAPRAFEVSGRHGRHRFFAQLAGGSLMTGDRVGTQRVSTLRAR